MKGPDIKENLVRLTCKQHFFVHFILWKTYKNRSMTRAYNLLSLVNGIRIKSWNYAAFKEGMTISDETKKKLSIAFTGRKRKDFTDLTKQKMSVARLGMNFSDVTKRKMSESAKLRKRIKHTAESKEKMRVEAFKREAKKKEAGFRTPEETKKKLSLALKDKPWSAARRAAHIGKWSDARRAKWVTLRSAK